MANKNKANNIIFVTISMVGGGTERVISVLANEAAHLGHHVTIMMIGDDRVEYELDERIEVICVSKATAGSIIARIKRITAMRNRIKSSDKANVISMGSSASIFTLIAAFGLKNKVVVSERNDPGRLNHKPISRSMRLIREFLYRRAHKIVLQTEDAKKCFSKKVADNSCVIMNPLPQAVYDRSANKERDKSIISSGRLIVYKGFGFLIDSFAEFVKIHPEYTLKIFGKGELQEELQNKIDEFNLSQKAFLCGFSDDMYAELEKGGMYISSSISEGVSNALMEALALGIPVIATDCPVGGSRMCIENEVNGILTEVNDKDAMVKAMCRIAQDEEFRENITQKAMEISKRWTVEEIWKQWEKLFI